MRSMLAEFTYICNRLQAYQDTISSTSSSADSSWISRPAWLPVPDHKEFTFPVVALGPMTKMTELCVDLTPSLRDEMCSYFLSSSRASSVAFLRLCWVLQMSPRLVKLTAQRVSVRNHHDPRFLAGVIAYLSSLEELDLTVFLVNQEQLLEKSLSFPFILMQEIGESQLEVLRVQECQSSMEDDLEVDTGTAALQRHSASLRIVNFSNCADWQGDAIGLVFDECSGLEVLKPTTRTGWEVAYIDLEDTVDSIPWKCTRLHHLEMTISETALPGDPILLMKPENQVFDAFADAAYEQGVKSKLDQLEKFYRQIGALTQLSHLHLRAVSTDAEGAPLPLETTPYRRNNFPGMLSLGDEYTGGPGYLDLLGGLIKLKKLQGSVLATTDQTRRTMGWPEARWMARHWPDLEVTRVL
ncbi:hypothetical protein BGW39_008970 [Mortierella sp. 14UC]|nr:hypothetical protein BGW39_008970 [Mortierella sp. 14UC]